jgi:hypothetical protein
MRSCSTTRDPRRHNGSRSVRGRQSANPRITGGLVSHEQAERSRAARFGTWETPTGSKRAAVRVAWSACRDLPALGSTYGSSHCGGQHQSVTGAACRLAGRQEAGISGCPATRLVASCSQYPRHRTPSPAAWGRAATAAWPAAPSGHRPSGRSGIAGGRVRRLDRHHDRRHRTA